MGHDPVELPLFRTVFHRQAPGRITSPSAFIVTSANALRALESAPLPDPAQLRVPVFAVGAATAAAARSRGFTDVVTGPGTAAGLADLLLETIASGTLAPSPDRPLIYLAGLPRSPDLEQRLSAAPVPVTPIVLYEMQEISYSTDFLNEAILSPPPDVLLLYSANAARRALAILCPQTPTDQRFDFRVLCLSAEIQAALPDPWRARALVAAAPDEPSLLASLAALR